MRGDQVLNGQLASFHFQPSAQTIHTSIHQYLPWAP